jgi:hypothetical protein
MCRVDPALRHDPRGVHGHLVKRLVERLLRNAQLECGATDHATPANPQELGDENFSVDHNQQLWTPEERLMVLIGVLLDVQEDLLVRF